MEDFYFNQYTNIGELKQAKDHYCYVVSKKEDWDLIVKQLGLNDSWISFWREYKEKTCLFISENSVMFGSLEYSEENHYKVINLFSSSSYVVSLL